MWYPNFEQSKMRQQWPLLISMIGKGVEKLIVTEIVEQMKMGDEWGQAEDRKYIFNWDIGLDIASFPGD